MDFKEWVKKEISDASKRAIYLRATTIGIPARRGISPKRINREYSTDPGDLGRGIYYDSSWSGARNYAQDDQSVVKTMIKFENPLVVSAEEAYEIADRFQTVRLPDKEWDRIARENGLDPGTDAKVGNALERDRLQGVVYGFIVKQLMKNSEAMTKAMLAKGHDGMIIVHQGHLEIVDYRPYR